MSKTSKQSNQPITAKPQKTTSAPEQTTVTQHKCHIHDKVWNWDVDDIRENVCVSAEKYQLTEFEGKHYCLFHLPTNDKDAEKFNEIFKARLNEIDQKCADIEAEFPDDEEKQRSVQLQNINYDFRYVWFPSAVNLIGRIFYADAYFSSATFTAAAYFSSATFTAFADFRSATFTAAADFRSVKFPETSQTFFIHTSFQGVASFQQAVVKGYLYFEAGIGRFFDGEWLDKEKTKPKKIERKTKVFEGRLDFAHVRAEKPERITFNKVRLHAGWFVNIDSRKFVFTDIAWENHRASKAELKQELDDLQKRGFDEPHNFQLLTVAFRNLAANAEEFNRFEEASNFRKSASECERLERLSRRKEFWKYFKANQGSWRLLRQAPFY
jgi:hypothetical protein